MGSVDGLINCPCCGMPARDTFFYHSSSYVTSCEFCGYLNYKMIWYEDRVPEDDPSLEDGYVIKHHDGHGVVIYRINNRFRSYDKKSDDERPSENMDVVLESFMKNGKLSKIVLHSGFDFTLPAVLCENNEGNYVFVPRRTGFCLPERCDAKAMKRRFANPYNSNYMSNAIPVEFADCAPYVYEDDDYDDLSNEKFPPEDIRIYTDYGYLTVIFFTKYPFTYYYARVRSDKVRDFVLALRNANVRRKTDFIKFCAAYKKQHEVKCNDVFGCGVTIRSRFVRNDVSDYIQPDQNIISKNVALEEYERKCDYKNFTPDNIAALVKYFTEKSNDHFKKY